MNSNLRSIGILMVWAFLAAPCFADDLPDKPQPHFYHQVGKVTADREFWIEAGAMGTAWTLDTISTHQAFADGWWRHETGALFAGSRSVPKIAGAWAAVDIGAAVTAYEWKKHVKNKYLHPLWRVPMMMRTVGHSQAAAANWSLKP